MLSLIRKDLLLHKHTLLILLPTLFIYSYLGTSNIWVAIVYCIVINMHVFATDEKSSANFLLNTLPYTRKQIVSTKYIGAFLFIFLTLVVTLMGSWIFHKELMDWSQVILIIFVVTVFFSFAFPFSYLFKTNYLVMASGVLFVGYMFVINLFIVDFNDRVREFVSVILSMDSVQFYVSGMFSVGLLYLLSWVLSIRIYSRKVF